MSNQLRITLVKSVIGRKPKHVEIIKQLGLSKINSTVLKNDESSIRGLINIVNYLVNVEECV